jgi:Ca-activated chloride channel family protein
MRPRDTFNVVTFAGHTAVLWEEPRPATFGNVEEARRFVSSRRGGGGTEMMRAVEAALVQSVPHGESAPPVRIVTFLTDGYVGNGMDIIDAVRRNARTTRVFGFGIGNSVNRYLVEGLAEAGRGASDIVLLSSDADEAVERFVRRIETPVLTDVELEFAEGSGVFDVLPGTAVGEIPDLFDLEPLVIHGRYARAGTTSVTIRGRTGGGRYERVVDLALPEREPGHDAIATLWARERVEGLLNEDLAAAQRGLTPEHLKAEIVSLGEAFQIVTQYTSFVAVEKWRVTVEGESRLVPVPIELPDGVSWEGVFGDSLGAVIQQHAAAISMPRLPATATSFPLLALFGALLVLGDAAAAWWLMTTRSRRPRA